MRFPYFPTAARFLGCLMALTSGTSHGWQPGSVPSAPARMPSAGFSVVNQNRNDVVALWHGVYQASEGYEKRIQWTGDYSGKSGTVSAVFAKDVERRINYFRAMCGIPAFTRVNTNSTVHIEGGDRHKPAASTRKSSAAQTAALMLIRNYNPATGADPAIDHDPSSALTGWSSSAWNANAKGNLAFGIFGPGAITEYMVEELASGSTTSAWNSLVGHRRWILFPEATNFATGDQPGRSVYLPPTNVLYVGQKPAELVPDPTPDFVAYPPPGYFPAPINSRYWSLSRSGADFSNAKVIMTNAGGKSVPVTEIRRSTGYGDPAIIWRVRADAAAKTVFADRKFNVTVYGIRGQGIPTSYKYTVSLINPDRLTSRQPLIGPASASANQNTSYSFMPPAGAEAMQMTAFLRRSTAWKETAGAASARTVIDNTASNYPLRANMASFSGFGGITGPTAFHLTFPTGYDILTRGVPEQSFELDRDIIAKANARLKFKYRRGFMTTGSCLVIERSTDGGVTWKPVGRPIKGTSNSNYDVNVSSASLPLPRTNLPTRVRFRYYTSPGAPIFTHQAAPGSPTGIFIDDITTANCDWLQPRKSNYVSKVTKKLNFNRFVSGAPLVKGQKWVLRLRTKLGGKWFPYGTAKAVTITAPR